MTTNLPLPPTASLTPSPKPSSVPCSHERDVTYQSHPDEPGEIQRKQDMRQGSRASKRVLLQYIAAIPKVKKRGVVL